MNPVRLIAPTVGEIKRLLADVPDEAYLELLNRTNDDILVTLKEGEWLPPAEDGSLHGSFVLAFCEVPATTFSRWLLRTASAQGFLPLDEVFHE